MIRKLLFLFVAVLTSVGAWADDVPAAVTLTNYQFTGTAVGNIFDANGTEQSVSAGTAMTGTYYLKVNYESTTAPATTTKKTFSSKDYYVKNSDNYSSAYGTIFIEGGKYATVNEFTQITDENKSTYTTTAYYFNSTAVSNGCCTAEQVTQYGQTYWQSTGTVVTDGSVCDPNAYYWYYGGARLGSEVASWGAATSVTNFNSTSGIYTKANDVYVPITSNAYDASVTYYYVTFSDIADALNIPSDALLTNTLVDLTDDSNTYYYKDGNNYTLVKDGDVYLGDNAYYAELSNPSYVLASYAELVAMGYATSYDKSYNCYVTTDETNSVITLHYHDYGNSGTLKEYINDAQSNISTYKSLAINSHGDYSFCSTATLKDLFYAIKSCNGIKNLVLADVANYGYSSKQIDLYNLQGSSIERVILPNATWTDASMQTAIDNRGDLPIIQAYNNNASTKNQEIIHCYTAGALVSISDAQYNTDEIDNAYWLEINGNINSSDISFINGIDNVRVNLSGATYPTDDVSKAALHNLANSYVKYLALPELGAAPADPLYVDLYSKCSNLKAVGQFVSSTGFYNAKTIEEGAIKYLTEMTATVTKAVNSNNPNTAITKLKVSGTLNASDIFATGNSATIDKDGHAYFYPAVDEYESISQTRTMGAMKDADGNVVEGHETTLNGAWDGAPSLSSIDLSDATFTHIEDMTLSRMNLCGQNTKEVLIPTSSSVTELPADFLNYNGNTMNEIMIPSNIEKIHARALYAADIMHITTNDVITTTGSSDNKAVNDHGVMYKLADNTESSTYADGATMIWGTYTFSSNLKFIGSGAFGGSIHIKDVYNHAEQAPECLVNAFSTVSYVANNSYVASLIKDGKITREAYCNGANTWMTVLHFPTTCSNDQVKLYKDVTRVYSIASDDLDDKGEVIYYPTQAEWNRSFHQGTTGYLWYAYCSRMNGGSGSSMGFYDNATGSTEQTADGIQYATGKTQTEYQAQANAVYNKNDYDKEINRTNSVFYTTAYTDAEGNVQDVNHAAISSIYYNTTSASSGAKGILKASANTNTLTDYRGWHQFVLTAYSSNAEITTVTKDFSDFSDDNWWTICEPFYMTKAEVTSVFGAGTIVKKLVSVTRDIANQQITLNFGTDRVTDTSIDDETEHPIMPGVPYMIKPGVAATDKTNPDNRLLSYELNSEEAKRFTKDYTSAELTYMLAAGQYTVPAIIKNNTGTYTEETVDKEMTINGKTGTYTVHKSLTYTFVGTFFRYVMPQYCYYLGWDSKMNSGKGGVAFFWKSTEADASSRKWAANTAIIVPNWNSSTEFYTPSGVFETVHYDLTNNVAGATDDYGSVNGSGDVTSAKHTVISAFDAIQDVSSAIDQPQVFGTETANGAGNIYNINGQKVNKSQMTKGIYIVNGKKFIVR